MKESRGILLIAIGWFRLRMGNSLGCSASGERLVSAARDGDVVEARMLLHINPSLARYSTFGGLNSPLHFAAAKGHNEIANMLLENGADVNSRNYCGQTALMHACRHGHWEVVQTLLLYKSNVIRADYFSGRTALHFAAVNGHVRCLRLVLADFIPSGEIEFMSSGSSVDDDKSNTSKPKFDKNALTKFVNKAADGGITTLHIAALNGYFDCVQLLLDINASVSATTFHYGTSMDLIGTGSTPLHYAACGGNLKCCQMLLAKGANKLALNCNGWLPADVARMWGRHWLEPLLAPNSSVALPTFPPSNYLCLPLMSIMSIAREFGFQATTASSDDSDQCSVCLERACSVAATGCGHEFCVKCALYLCSSTNVVSDNVTQPGSIPCPLCRNSILSFIKLPSSPKKELTLSRSLSFCAPCMLHGPGCTPPPASVCRSDLRKNRVAAVSSDFLCPVSCSPFPSMTMPLCTCNDDPCPPPGAIDSDNGSEDPRPSSESIVATEQPDFDGRLVGETSCSKLFWHRRSSHREQQCNSEINV